jgi:RNA polymerase sigma-70 factor (sigma-E family)
MSRSRDLEFSSWVAARGRALERYAFVLTGDRQRAEDLVQNTLLRVYRQWNRLSGMDHPDAYVRQIVTNQYLDWRRRRQNTETADLTDNGPPAPDPAIGVVDRDELARALQGITPHQRAVLVLRHVEGLDDQAIAAVLGCSAGTVRSHAARGRERLRVLLSGNDIEPMSGRNTR